MITLKKKFSDSYNFVHKKIVILRVDLNVPIVNGQVTDTTRVKKILPTIFKLLEHKAKIIIVSHMGRPKGKWSEEFTIEPVAKLLELLTENKIHFLRNNVKNITRTEIDEEFKNNNLIMVENIRFYPEEEKNEEKFAKKLSSLADIFINECFSCSHRAHASISGIPAFLPAFPGQLLENEILNLKNLFLVQNHLNGIAVLGGSKISTKIKLIEFYVQKFSKLLIGGAMANTLCFSQGHEIGISMYEKKMIEFCKDIIKSYKEKILLPIDFIVTDKKLERMPEVKLVNKIDKADMIVDIGPQTRMLFYNEILKTSTVLWNGPLGLFEKKPFDEGTAYVLKAIKLNKNKNFFSVAGGGDTIAVLNQTNSFDVFSFVSTGGGAFLEFVQGASMPGLSSLNH